MSAQIGAYYYLLRLYSQAAPPGSCAVSVCTLINYGNATVKWYNETSVPANWNFYKLTSNLTGGRIEAQFYGLPLNEHFVTGINGVKNQSPFYWTLWIFCQKQNAWAVSPVGADLIHPGNGETLAWAYEIPYHTPIPGTRTVDSCS